MNTTRATLNMSANLDGVERLLRQDLRRIPDTLWDKPKRIHESISSGEHVSDLDGYLEIVEGPDTVESHPYVDENGDFDSTVGDVDDIIAFTATADPAIPFRGLFEIDGKLQIVERNFAEIVWFVRGNTLYRRVRLIDDQNPANDPNVNTVEDLARRERRFGHDGLSPNPFPHPLYEEYPGWYYLRMPTLEETLEWSKRTDSGLIGRWKEETNVPAAPDTNPDLWGESRSPHFFPDLQDKESGSLAEYVTAPRHHRAGEDIVLTNVLSFDIKVWCPIKKDFADLGTQGTVWENSKQPDLSRTWDSWTREYKDEPNPFPPYTEPLEAIQITIRCFDPASRIVKQITVVHRFKN